MRFRLALPTALIALCVALVPTIAGAWRFEDDVGRAVSIAVDGAGDAVVAGDHTIKLDGATGTEIWRDTVGSLDVAFHPSGDALVTRPGFGARRLDAATGAPLWDYQVFGTELFPNDAAVRVVADGASAAIVAGSIHNAGVNQDFAVAKVDSSTGAEIWRFETGGLGSSIDRAQAVAVDAAGDVFAAGYVDDTGFDRTFVVLKLDGLTGAEVWRYQSVEDGWCEGLSLDGAGAVLAVGRLEGARALKLDPATGGVLWEHVLSSGTANAVTVDGNDDVIIAASPGALLLAKLDGSTGTELWQTLLEGHEIVNTTAEGVALDGSGDVFVAGRIQAKGHMDAVIAKVSGTSGEEQWRQQIDGPVSGRDALTAVAVDSSGRAFASGDLALPPATGARYLAVRVDGATGIIGPVAGKKLVVRDGIDPSRRRITATLREQTIILPAPGGASDPTLAGASVVLSNPATAESATFPLPPGGSWKGLGSPAGSKGYKYADPLGLHGPCRALTAKPGKLLKVSCTAKLMPIPFSLDEPTQGSLTISIGFGSDAPHCGVFGGDIKADTGVGHPGPTGRFAGKKAPAVGHCP